MSEAESFLNDVLQGLAASRPALPCKYLYDQRGSALFEAICQTQDYYITRADLALHDLYLDEISLLIGPDAHVIEFGSGAGIKTRKLLASLNQPRAYTPIEISASALNESETLLRRQFPDLEIRPLRADYTQAIDDEELLLEPPARRRVIYFPGSTISNFDHEEARHFLARLLSVIGDQGGVLIGVDLLKPTERLVRAYDDSEGITAQFNLNLLERMVRELDARIELDAFAHEARFNEEQNRIEMHLLAQRDTTIEIGNHRFAFRQGESIHTENSHKYSIDGFRSLAVSAGLTATQTWTDPEGLFSMHWLTVSKPGTNASP
ncbi:MAG: L-histidine N(alpha)-methyltransferase [Pseudomonadota bacterium]